MLGVSEPEVEHGDERLTTGQHFGLVGIPRQERIDLCAVAGPVVAGVQAAGANAFD